MGKINILDSDLINKIAAGEVVERPASVVKELVENSIDAGASHIEIYLEKGGTQLIKISDNGSGMDEEDATKAFLQHATSKINSADDLERIISFGFRGEALASISSVAQTEIHTFDGSSNPLLVTSTNNIINTVIGEGRQKGTTVIVRNIFGNVPARRKFLKSEQTEFRHILDVFIDIAIANYKIGFELFKDNNTYLTFPACNNLKDRILQVLEKNLEAKLISINYESEKLKISGFIGHPSMASERQFHQHIFLNKRPIEDKLIAKAIKEGFTSTIAPGLKPVYFLFIDIAPELVDVNVHPRKLEVRFADQRGVFSAVYHSIKGSLEKSLQNELVSSIRSFTNADVKSQQIVDQPVRSEKQGFSDFSPKQSQQSLGFNHSFNNDFGLLQTTSIDQQSDLVFPEQTSILDDYIQLFNTYLVFSYQEKMLVVDQHAADERINYEAIESQISSEGLESMQLLVPAELSLAANLKAKLTEFIPKLHGLGFEVNELPGNSYQVSAIPLILKDKDYIAALNEVLTDLELESGVNSRIIDKAIATLACHSSVRAGQHLERKEALELINKLFNCKLPYSCPHGRPIIWEISRNELEKQFKRKL